MLPHPDTVRALARIDQRQVLAAAARAQLAAGAASSGTQRAVLSDVIGRLRDALPGKALHRGGRLPVVPNGEPATALR